MHETASHSADTNSIEHPTLQATAEITSTLSEAIQSTCLDAIELRISAQEETVEEQTIDDTQQFTYQPGTLWITFNDEYNAPVTQTPNCTTGMTIKPTAELPNTEPVSEHFLYTLYETLARTESEIGLSESLIQVDDSEVRITERYHLQELLRQAFDPDETPGVYTELVLQKAKHEFSPDTGESTNTSESNTLFEGTLNGLETDIPNMLFEDGTVTKNTETEPYAAIGRLFDAIHNAENTTITISTFLISDHVMNAVQNAAENGCELNILLDREILPELDTPVPDLHDNINIDITGEGIQAPVVTIGDKTFVTTVDGSRSPETVIESDAESVRAWADDHFDTLNKTATPIEAHLPTAV